MTEKLFDVFVSYSRRQFYFTESLVLNLEKAGINAWFDVQQLGPGELWRDQINEGIDSAKAFVLIGSRASVASGNVKDEWMRAIANNLDIYVVLFEACVIPPELADKVVAVIDARGNFRRGVRRLLETIRDKKIHKDPIPKPNRWNVPMYGPFVVGYISLIMLLACILYALGIVVMARPGWRGLISTIFSLFWVWFVGKTGLNFLRREFTYSQLFLAAIVTLDAYSIVMSGFAFLPLMSILAILVFSSGIYRWLPTGQAPKFMRQRFGSGTVGRLKEFKKQLMDQLTPKPKDYALHYSSPDEKIAGEISSLLDSNGNRRVAVDHSDADYHIAILSNQTPVTLLADLVERYPDKLIPVLATGVDARKAVKQSSEFQFVDYRRWEKEQLEAVWLVLGFPQEARTLYGLMVLPLSTRELVLPRGVRNFGMIMWLLSLAYTLVASVSFVQFTTWLGQGNAITADTYTQLYFFAVPLLLVIAQLWLMGLVYERRITMSPYRRRMIYVGLASIAIFLFGIPHLILYLRFKGQLNRWFPTSIPKDDSVETLQSHSEGTVLRLGIRDLLIVFSVVVSITLSAMGLV